MCGFESVVLNELCGCGVGEWCGFDVGTIYTETCSCVMTSLAAEVCWDCVLKTNFVARTWTK